MMQLNSGVESTGVRPHLISQLFDLFQICTVVPTGARRVGFIPALDLQFRFGVGLLQGLHFF